MKILSYIAFAIIAMVGVMFASLNPYSVKINYLFSSLTMPLSVLVVLVLGIGICIGLFICVVMYVRLKREIFMLKSRVKIAQQEVDNLRALPLHDVHQ